MAPPTLQHLATTRHSPTTINYSVTNRPLPKSISAITISLLDHILRLTLLLWAWAITILLLRQHLFTGISFPYLSLDPGIISTLQTHESVTTLFHPRTAFSLDGILATLLLPLRSIHGADWTPSFLPLTSTVPPSAPLLSILLTLTLLYTLSLSNGKTTTESLLVLSTLGLQTSTQCTSFPLLIALGTMLKHYFGTACGLHALFASTTTRFIPTSQVQDVLVHEAFKGWEVRYYLAVVVKGEERVVVVFERLLPRLEVVESVWRGVREVLWEGTVGAGDGEKGKGEEGSSDM